MFLRFPLFLCLCLVATAQAAPDYSRNIAALADPVRLATLGERGANPRVQKIVYWLETARREGQTPGDVMAEAFRQLAWEDERGRLTAAAMLRNLDIATKLGCLDDEGMAKMRRGQCPTVRNGPYAGDLLTVDHIVPRSLVPELDNVLANLELMPGRLNRTKGASFGQRQEFELARFRRAGLMEPVPQAETITPASRIEQPEPAISAGAF